MPPADPPDAGHESGPSTTDPDPVTLPPPPNPPEEGSGDPGPSCVRDLAFWKTAPIWPADTLDIGGRIYTEAEMREIVALDRTGDASIVLAQDFIGTHMNECDGCGVPDHVFDLMVETHLWMQRHDNADVDGDGSVPFGIDPASPEGREAERIAAGLRAWMATGR